MKPIVAVCAAGAAAGIFVSAITPSVAARRHHLNRESRRSYHRFGFGTPTPLMAFGSQDYLSDTSTTIALAGQDVLRVRTGAAGFSPQQRAEAIRLRLIPILSMKNLQPDDVQVAALPQGERAIMVRGQLLATVDNDLAQANGATPAELAQTWADNFRATLPVSRVAP